MTTRLVQIAMNARDDSALGRFWAEALGWTLSSEGPGVTNLEPVGFVYPDPVAVCIDVIRVPEPKTVKNRVHVDLATTSVTHQDELVKRLRELGATPIGSSPQQFDAKIHADYDKWGPIITAAGIKAE